jgi:hypothetical protein
MASHRHSLRPLLAVIIGPLIAVVLFTVLSGQWAIATHEPANEVAAAGARSPQVFGPGTNITLLTERVRVSNGPADLILQVTAECAILNQIQSDGVADLDRVRGEVRVWVEIDGTPVPVSSDDTTVGNIGKVVFCNRLHDRAQNLAAVASQRVFLATRAANGFNWFALNVGDPPFDTPGNGNNVLDVVVKADFNLFSAPPSPTCPNPPQPPGDPTPPQVGNCVQAAVGARTLIIEPTHASVHEEVNVGPGIGD